MIKKIPNMIEGFAISILANIATETGRFALKKILKTDELETQINQAFDSALKKWTVNSSIRKNQNVWTTRRLNQLLDYLKKPNDDYEFEKSTKELIDLFYLELQKKDTAWNFIQGEHFKTEINKLNTLESHLELLVKELKEEKLQPKVVIETLKRQTENQISKQIATEKYIPDTFIETDEFKDYLRYFVAPFTFYPKLINETSVMNFTHLNKVNKTRGKEVFEFNFDKFKKDNSKVSLLELYSESQEIESFLDEKYNELENNRSNSSYPFTRKIKTSKESFEYIHLKAILLTDDAGQGKTNLLCDFAENVLIKREISSVFLTGYEIDESNISESIAKRLFPNDDFTLNEIFNAIENSSNTETFVIIIDGINENPNPKLFSQNLEIFIESLINKDFIKIILTCRTEYFKNNFENLLNSSFSKKIKLINGLNNRLNKNQKQRLFDTYLSYFDMKIDYINEEIQKQLVNNFLLLRIFSEVNKGMHLPNVNHIYKSDLFSKYYKSKVKEINDRLSKNDEFKINGNLNIGNFIGNIASYMISNQTFHNIPIDKIIKDDNNREIYIRFLDENIILKKDLTPISDSIFDDDEVINFTFDEFRDFIISDYLITKSFKEDKDKFEKFIKENLVKKSPILEGCSIFLYSLSRNADNTEINDFLEVQEWFDTAFLNVIFNTPDKEIKEEDKLKIKDLFTSNKTISNLIISELAYKRYDEKEYPNLNITLLFEIFNDLTKEQFATFIYSFYQSYSRNGSIDNIISQLYEFLEKFKSGYHNLFKFILYFLPLSYKVSQVYGRYYKIYPNKKQLLDISKCQNKELSESINSLIGAYDI